MELAVQDGLLELVFHGRQLVAFDSEDRGNHFVMERLPQFVDRRDRVLERQQGLEARAVQGGDRPTEDGVVTVRVVKLAAEGRHRLPHDRVPQPHQRLVFLQPQHTAARHRLFFHQGGVEHQFHAVGS